MPRPLTLTPRRQRVYDFILKFKKDHDGVSPSVSEIGTACGISSTSMVRDNLDSLERLGFIECDYGKGRSRMIKVVGGRWVAPTQPCACEKPVPHDQADHVVSLSSTPE